MLIISFFIKFNLNQKINNINDNETEIILPPKYISLPYLNIKKNIIIKGSPGTLVEIENGYILINEGVNVFFSECSILFNYEQDLFIEKLKSQSQKKSNIILEKIDYLPNNKAQYSINCIKMMEDSSFEINDCDIRSLIHQDEEIFEDEDDRRLIKNTLINSEIPEKFLNTRTKINMNSSICSNFGTILKANNIEDINIDNCHFSEIIENVLFIKNCRNFNLDNTKIIIVQLI